MKKKILFAYPEMMVGGSTTSLLSLLNTIDYNEYEVDLILYKNRGVFLNDIPHQVNLLQQACKFPRHSFLITLKKVFILLKKSYLIKALIDEFKYNKRLGFNKQTMAYAQTFISRKLNKRYDIAIGYLELWADAYILNNVKSQKIITWIHTDYSSSHLIPAIDFEQFCKSDSIVCVSENCLKNLKISFPTMTNKLKVVENILSPKYIKGKAMEKIHDFDNQYSGIRIITVCRLNINTKGLDRIILASKKLCDEKYIFKWYILGDGGDRSKLQKLIIQFNLENNVILLGEKINPYPYYQKCNLFVLPSRYEGKPMSVTEAQIMGIPVIVTRYSSAEEQVNQDIDGLIVDNDDLSIYHGIKKILDNPELLVMFKKSLINRKIGNEDCINQFYSLIK